MKALQLKTINFLEYYFIPFFQKYVKRKKKVYLSDIGLKQNGKNAPRALVINLETAIPFFVTGSVEKCEILNNHSLIWQVYDLVKQLIDSGYVVDFRSSYDENLKIDWAKYRLVIDERNNLINAPAIPGQVRVFYATGLPFDFQNNAELKRIEAFYRRTGVIVDPVRFVRPVFSDKVADYILFKGNPEWMSLYDPKPIRHQLNISVTHEIEIEIEENAKGFLWLGSTGAVHKGLDLAVEAFRELPEYTLHIFGNIENEKNFFGWLSGQMLKYKNIRYHSYADFNTQYFHSVLKTCIGHVFPSCSENGAASVAQTSYWGLIPITTKATNNRSQHLGFVSESENEEEIISDIRKYVRKIFEMPPAELASMQNNLKQFARKYHTKAAYSESVIELIKKIKK